MIYHTLYSETIMGKTFPMNSIVVRMPNGIRIVTLPYSFIYCKRSWSMELFCYLPSKKAWVKTYAKNEMTEIIWDYYTKNLRRKKVKKQY